MPWQLQCRFTQRQQQQKPFWPVNSGKIQPRVNEEDQIEEPKCFVLRQWLVRRTVGVATEPAERAARTPAGKNAAERQAQKKKKKKETLTVNKPQ